MLQLPACPPALPSPSDDVPPDPRSPFLSRTSARSSLLTYHPSQSVTSPSPCWAVLLCTCHSLARCHSNMGKSRVTAASISWAHTHPHLVYSLMATLSRRYTFFFSCYFCFLEEEAGAQGHEVILPCHAETRVAEGSGLCSRKHSGVQALCGRHSSCSL